MNSHKLICSPNSGETYYFRSYIPTDLIEYFDGVRQFRVSLKCAIKSRSLRITKILDVKVSSLFEEIRIGMKSLDIEQIKEILSPTHVISSMIFPTNSSQSDTKQTPNRHQKQVNK